MKTVICGDGIIYLVITAAIFVGAMIREVNLLLFLASVLTCLAVFDFVLGKRSLSRLSVERLPPPIIHAGEPFLVTAALENRHHRRSSWAVVVEDQITPLRQQLGTEGDTGAKEMKSLVYRPVCFFDRIDAGKKERQSYVGRIPLRGRYRLGPFSASTRFPAGFFRSSVLVDVPGEMVVFPKIGTITELWLRDFYRNVDPQYRYRQSPSRVGDDLFGIRSWQSGDSRKAIHWQSTAKHQSLYVRKYQEPHHREVAIFLDLTDGGTLQESFENIELGISFAATLLKEMTQTASGSITYGSTSLRPAVVGRSGFPIYFTIMSDLATLQYDQTANEERLWETFRGFLNDIKRPTNLLIISTSNDDLSHSDRFGKRLRNDPRSRLLTRIDYLNVPGAEFAEIFQP